MERGAEASRFLAWLTIEFQLGMMTSIGVSSTVAWAKASAITLLEIPCKGRVQYSFLS